MQYDVVGGTTARRSESQIQSEKSSNRFHSDSRMYDIKEGKLILRERYERAKQELDTMSKLITSEHDNKSHVSIVNASLKEFIHEPANGPECNRHKLCHKHMRNMLTLN